MHANAKRLPTEEPVSLPPLQPALVRPKLGPAMLRFLRLLRLAFWRAFQHDAFSIAKASAYSSILTFFPALLIVGSVLATWRKGAPYLREISYALSRILPAGSNTAMNFLRGAAQRPFGLLLTASLITLWTASGVMVSWMEGFRRCYELPKIWGLIKERFIAFAAGHFRASAHDLRHAAGRLRQQNRNQHPVLHRARIQPLHSSDVDRDSLDHRHSHQHRRDRAHLPQRRPAHPALAQRTPRRDPGHRHVVLLDFAIWLLSAGTTPITALFTARSARPSRCWSGCTWFRWSFWSARNSTPCSSRAPCWERSWSRSIRPEPVR